MLRVVLKRLLQGDRRTTHRTDDLELQRAISLVLHEHSESAAVCAAAADAQQHADIWLAPAAIPPVVEYDALPAADSWLTATLGCPAVLRQLASEQSDAPAIVTIDQLSRANATADLFRAPARLNLPDSPQQTLVIAAVVRSGAADVAIFWDGPFLWPEQDDAALRAIERLIQAHVGQWHPPANLWEGGAEDVLPAGEIMDV